MIHLSQDDIDTITANVDAACDHVNAALEAADAGRLTTDQVAKLARAQGWLDALLAFYTDGPGYFALPDDLLDQIDEFSSLAEEIMEPIMAKPANAYPQQTKIRPGRYKITHRINDVKPALEFVFECNNPAFGLLRVYEWEQQTRMALAQNKAHIAAQKTARAA